MVFSEILVKNPEITLEKIEKMDIIGSALFEPSMLILLLHKSKSMHINFLVESSEPKLNMNFLFEKQEEVELEIIEHYEYVSSDGNTYFFSDSFSLSFSLFSPFLLNSS